MCSIEPFQSGPGRQMHQEFGAWDTQGQRTVFLCNSAASEASARSLSLQATRCRRHCRYIDFQLVLSTNFQRQHGKVEPHKMPRPDWKEALMHSNSFEAWWCAASNPSKRAASNLCWLFFIVLTTNQGMPRNTDPVVHHAVRAASNTSQSKALCFSLLPKKT